MKKRDFYLSADVEQYWVMDLDLPMVEQWTKHRHTPVVARQEISWHPSGADQPFLLNLPNFVRQIPAMMRGGWVADSA